MEYFYSRVFGCPGITNSARFVCASVINQNDFQIPVGLVCYGLQTPVQKCVNVINGNYDADKFVHEMNSPKKESSSLGGVRILGRYKTHSYSNYNTFLLFVERYLKWDIYSGIFFILVLLGRLLRE